MSFSDEEQCIPTSDPFEEVLLPSYSQREETREEVERLMLDQHKRSQAKQIRRMLIKAEKRGKIPTHSGQSQIGRSCPSKKLCDLDNGVDLDLLILHCSELEEERDRAQEECLLLRGEKEKIVQELRQCKRSLTFFQKETGRWRWAAANADTRVRTVLREFRAALGKLADAADVLSHPASAA
ncbi:hypothetical protein B0H19DRAFT_1371297 [Mycena capillaripes]|nr:hypothetical protein B0H19DRAFT_1371297 [Mycena capillaripes]